MRGHRRRVVAAGLVVLGTATGTTWLLTNGEKATVIVAVLTLTVAVLALAAQLLGIPWRTNPLDQSTLLTPSKELAREVFKRETVEQNKFLAQSGRSKPANVTFARAEDVSWPRELVVWRNDGGSETGSLEEIASFYQGSDVYPGLVHGRLVVLGDAGAGKTVLVNQLLLNLIDDQLMDDTRPGTPTVVPIRFSLPTFHPSLDYRVADTSIIASSIDNWIIRHLIDVFAVRAAIADALVRNGLILPILDGLDEMDPVGVDAPRAAAVVRALNHPTGGGLRRVVITCRKDRYKQLAVASSEPGRENVLQDATVVEIEPLRPSQVVAYLIKRFPDPSQDTKVQQRWQAVLDKLTAQPTSSLARALGSPLRLFLAVTAYHKRDTQPAELIGLSAEELDGHLFDKFIPAVVIQNSPPSGAYSTAQVTRWLASIAHYLAVQERFYGLSGSDLDLHRLWTAAGYRTPRYLAAIATGMLISVPFLLIGGWYILDTGYLLAPDLGSRLTVIGIIAYVLWAVFRASRPAVKLRRLDLSRLRTSLRQRLLPSLAVIALTALPVYVLVRLVSTGSFTGRVALMLAISLVMVARLTVSQAPSAIGRPSELIVQGRTYDIAIWLCGGLFIGLLFGLYNSLKNGSAFGFSLGLAAGLAITGIIDSDSPWLRYLFTTQILASRGELPRRPALFLDWAYSAGLVRLSGISIQFRHRELQDRLAGYYQGGIRGAVIDNSKIAVMHYRRNALTRGIATEHLTRGRALAKSGRLQEALDAFAEAIRLRPEDSTAHFSYGLALSDDGRHQEAIDAYAEAIRLKPKYSSAYNNLGNEFEIRGRYQEALDAYAEAIRLKPNKASRYSNYGRVLEIVGRHEEALAACAKAVRLKPRNGPIRSELGLVLLLQGQDIKAASCFRRAIDLEPSDCLEARVLLAALLWRLDPDQSVELSKTALAKAGENLSAFRRAELRALARLMLGESDIASTELRSALAAHEPGEIFQSALYKLFDTTPSSGVEKLRAIWAEIFPPL